MASITNVQCVVLLFARNKRRCGLCLRKALQPLLAHALAPRNDMTNINDSPGNRTLKHKKQQIKNFPEMEPAQMQASSTSLADEGT